MLQAFLDIFSGKAKTRVYVTFIGWFLLFHVDIIFIALFVDQSLIFSKTGLLKGEYIVSYALHFGFWAFMLFELTRLLLATLTTYLMIWVIPGLISEKSYTKELAVEYALRKMKLRKDEELNDKEERAVKKQIENLEAEKKVAVEKIKLEESPDSFRWDQEYNDFRMTRMYGDFDRVVSCVYKYSGKPGNMLGNTPKPAPELLGYLDANGVITIKTGVISFTDKGRHFVKRFYENF